jgi:hypothetical protein
VREADNRHHRDRRRPGLLTVLGRIVERKKRRPVLPAAAGVAVDLEATAVRGQAGKVSVAGAARLAGLPRKARQSARRRPQTQRQKMQQRAVPLRQGAANKTERLLFVVRPLRRAVAVSTWFGTADETGRDQDKKEIGAALCRNTNDGNFSWIDAFRQQRCPIDTDQ